VADDRVAAAVAELYGADPDAFTERRKALVVAAREAGERAAATSIAALRKPTRAAWLVNRLARADPDAPARLAALAAELRAAEQAKDGTRLRELSASRGALIDALTAQALAAAGTPDPPPSLRAEVTETLTAALADPETAAGFAAGTLTKAAQWSGFGYADLAPADDPPSDDAAARGSRSPAGAADTAEPEASRGGSTGRSVPSRTAAASRPTPASRLTEVPRPTEVPRLSPASPPIRLPKQASRLKSDRAGASSAADAHTARASARAAAQRTALDRKQRAAQERERQQQQQRQAAQEQRLAQEEAERAARAREKFNDAERTLAQASAAAAEAAAVEDRLEAEVRDLEGRVTQAREDLAAARRRARHAEAAERRARHGLDRLPPP
jgi:hypothetical protein